MPCSHLPGDRSALLGGRGGRLMSPFCFTATPLQAPPSSAPSSPARTRHRHLLVGGRAGGKVSGQSPGVGGEAVCLCPLALAGAPRAGSGAGSPEVGRVHHQVGGASVFLPGSPKRQRPSSLGPDPVSSPSVALLGGGAVETGVNPTASRTRRSAIRFSRARRGAPRGRPAQAALVLASDPAARTPGLSPPSAPRGSPRRSGLEPHPSTRGGAAASLVPRSGPAAERGPPSRLADAGMPPGPRGLRAPRCRRPGSAGAGWRWGARTADPGPGGEAGRAPRGREAILRERGAAARWLRGHEVGRGAAHSSGTRVERALPPITAAALRVEAPWALMTAAG